jgi:formate hydrogenlyase subunit 6/NADH:ubiquinone oxidoreductase subunit I
MIAGLSYFFLYTIKCVRCLCCQELCPQQAVTIRHPLAASGHIQGKVGSVG